MYKGNKEREHMAKKEFLVTTIDRVRTTYVVLADNEDEAREMKDAEMIDEEFYEREDILSVEVNE